MNIGLRLKLQDIDDSKLKKPEACKRYIGLDLGNQLGFAFYDDSIGKPTDFSNSCGMLNLKGSERESWASRFIRFESFLNKIKPDTVFYEEVKQHYKSNAAANNYGGLLCTLTVWCEKNNIPAIALDVGSIKRYATGKGNAGKPDMIDAANNHFGMAFDKNNEKRDGDVSDALHVLALGMSSMYSVDLHLSLQPLEDCASDDGKRSKAGIKRKRTKRVV